MTGASTRGRSAAAFFAAAAISLPVGYAVASGAGIGDSAVDEYAGVVPAEECPSEVNAAFEAAGLPRDAFGPGCPTIEEAKEQASSLNELRIEGLQAIAESIRKYGDPDDAAELSRIEAELNQLRGGSGE
jgi:hypothetical protein